MDFCSSPTTYDHFDGRSSDYRARLFINMEVYSTLLSSDNSMKIKEMVISQFQFKEHDPKNETHNIFTNHAILYAPIIMFYPPCIWIAWL